ncbi:restriction endonuclease subunit S [Vibrio cholerae]|uniref:restriction endonuclease subunit S n=1 Tax=Vibrio cholerae TaxID=666 RepID=UPI00226EBEA2|nr:restriction endonuclease subunit S [Vibrio cholerae]MCX9450739.1 restriction endonuclease subunit S [Vibrio cholerae]HDL9437659.1 restriction endonuclease subunit S [Vibrio cholerae]
MSAEKLITDHIDIWTSSIQAKSASGRGSSKKRELYGIKKLRELILELAVRGKLVPQDPTDEPANNILARSIAIKESLLTEGKIKKSRAKKDIKEEHFYDYPASWATAKIEDLIQVINGRAYKKSEMLSSGIPILRVGNLFTSNEWYYSDLDLDADKYIDRGDLIYAWSASFGPFIWEGSRVIYHYHIWKMDIFHDGALDKNFSKLFLQAISERIKASGNGIAMIHMTKERMEKVVHPLPPIEEQRRIVAKVDELMTLCDQLEQQTEASLDAHQVLVETLLATLTNSQDATELMANWGRISEHFDTLFTTEQSIDQLKQTILQLAVMGKLVPQDPNDEPAAKLLERIAEEKAQLVKEKKIKKQKALPPIAEDEKPFELPNGWEWVKFGELSEFINGDRSKNYPNKDEYVDQGIPWINTGHIEPDGTLTTKDMNFITKEKFDTLRSGKIIHTDLVYCLRGATFGKTAFVSPYVEGAIASSLMIIRPYNVSLREFFYTYLISPFGHSQIFRFDNGSAQPNLSANSVMLYAFPCPPIEEQIRITTKVRELFLMCDQLKQRLRDSQQTQLQLTDAIIEQPL